MPRDHRVSRSFTAQLTHNQANLAHIHRDRIESNFFVQFGEATSVARLAETGNSEMRMKRPRFACKTGLGTFVFKES
jgi:hypothetical protein